MTIKTSSTVSQLLRTASAGTIAAAIGFVPMAQAADHWLSGARPAMVSSASALGSPSMAAAAGSTVFDITISLDTDPQGDDDSTKEDGANDEAQRKYEERIKEFANAVFQATNGKHKLGKVTIYRKKELFDLVDIQWLDVCPADQGPRARISGFGKPGQHIHQCNTWGTTDMSAPKPSGYTMAHEWGHYTYGVYDEYAQEQCDAARIAAGTCFKPTPRATDTAAIPSLMNNQWIASGIVGKGAYTGDASDFLEFSTTNIAPYTAGNAGQTAHKRVFGESIWTTLTRSSATDPKYDWMPARTHYADLVAPVSPNFIVKDDESTARSELDIRWVGTQVAELMIDVSGSMSGAPIDNARTAANLLIDQLPVGKSSVGVGSFNSSAGQNFAITLIPDPDTGVKAGAKAAVNALGASGLTAMYDGLMLALNEVTTFTSQPGQSGSGVVYLLSDGGDNSSSATPAEVEAAYKAAGVAIVALGYGSGAPTSVLSSLANATGGQFFFSPTTLPEIQAAFVAANAAFSSTMLATNAIHTVGAGATLNVPLAIDSTMESANLNLSFTGSATDIAFRLLSPAGADSGAVFTCSGATSCKADLDAAFIATNGRGTYQVEMVSAAGSAVDVTTLMTAQPNGEIPFSIGVGFRQNTTVYPAPLVLEASASKGYGLTGLAVTAVVTDAFGSRSTVTLLDDGKNGDILADDGVYSASLPYTADGNYSAVVTASNEAGTAQTTNNGTDGVIFPGTGPAPVFTPTDITENFSRAASALSTVTGVAADDHADDPAGGTCTTVSDDNVDTAGRVDFAGDVDCFTFVPSSTSDALVVRATRLTGGMDAVVTVYNSTGATEIAKVDLSKTESTDSGLVLTVAAASLQAAGHVVTVEHKDPAATAGNYEFSVGAKLVSDTTAAVVPVGGGGGSMGPFGLLGLGLLSLIGLRRRRRA